MGQIELTETPSTANQRAAEPTDATAQYNLGVRYQRGQGVPQDYAEAMKWFRKAADQGNSEAQFNLGVMYADGQGVPQDHAAATTWYRKAADQGDADAQVNLGLIYYNGIGGCRRTLSRRCSGIARQQIRAKHKLKITLGLDTRAAVAYPGILSRHTNGIASHSPDFLPQRQRIVHAQTLTVLASPPR